MMATTHVTANLVGEGVGFEKNPQDYRLLGRHDGPVQRCEARGRTRPCEAWPL